MMNDHPSAGTDSASKHDVSRDRERHVQLRALLSQIEAKCQAAALGSLVAELESLLREHFKDEEGPHGLYEAVASMAPRYSARLESLAAEHASLLASAEGVRQRVVSAQRDIAELVTKLRRHEQAETATLNEAVLADLGGDG